jgi:ABC-type glycerol-3-phosphate transport system substrate-binding protein
LHDAFARGQLTYYVCNSDEILDLRQTLKDDLQVAVLPGGDSTYATPLLYTRSLAINHSASPNERKLALALAKFLTNPEQQLQGVAATQSFIPVNRTVRVDRSLLPIEAVLLKQSQTAVAIPLESAEKLAPLFKRGRNLYFKALQGEIDPAQAALELTFSISPPTN